MTDRVNALIVALAEDLRGDDVESLAKAINHFRGVLCVRTHVADVDSFVATSRVRDELSQRLWAALNEAPK